MAQYAQNLFSEEHRVSGPARRRILHTLTRIWEHLRITDADGTNPRRVTVMEPPEGEHCRIEVHQSIQSGERRPRLTEGQSVRVISSDNGVRIGTRGRVEGIVVHQDYIAYTLVFVGDTYRQERRNAFRVPVEAGDGVDAEIVLTPDADAIDCRVHDLSMTGAWLELSGDPSVLSEPELSADTPCTVGLALPDRPDLAYSDALTVWTDWSDAEGCHIGVTWRRPEPEFKRALRRFVMNKERELAKRRARA